MARKNPLTAYGPEVLNALIRGGRKELPIPMPSYTRAKEFQNRCHSLRTALRVQEHKLSPLAERAKVSLYFGSMARDWYAARNLTPTVVYPDTEIAGKISKYPRDRRVPALIVIAPRDSQFTDILKSAGISADELKDDPLLDTSLHETDIEEITSGDDLLSQLGFIPGLEDETK